MAAASSRHPPPQSPPPQDSGSEDMEEAPELSLQQLRDTINQLADLEEEYTNQLREKEQQELDNEPLTPDMIIDFIDEIHYADRYWDLKQYLEDFPSVSVSGSLFDAYIKKLEESEKNFDLHEADVRRCVYFHIQEFRGERYLKRKTEEMKKLKLIQFYGDKKSYTAEEQSMVDNMPPTFEFEPERDTYALSHPIWKLVLQARKNEYVMDKDPQKELEKHDRSIFHFYFLLRYDMSHERPREYLENTVMLPNVSGHTYVQDVEKLLSSCGEILCSKLESGRGKIRTIYVTFKYPEGAKLALEKKSLHVRGRNVVIETPQPAFTPSKSHDTSEDKVAAEEAAINKYNGLIAKFAQLSNDVGVLANFTQVSIDEEADGEFIQQSNIVKDDESRVKCAGNIKNAKKGGKPAKKHKRRGPSKDGVAA